MQFVDHGPNIPDELIDAHESGRLIFFCGSGISKNAGMPNFKELTEEIYTSLGHSMKASERDAWCKNQYDTTLQLLQRRLANGNNQIREEVLNILSKKAASELDLSTHTALLDLSMNSEKRMRLVTTNFDRFFLFAAWHSG